MHREAFRGVRHLLVGDGLGRELLQRVDPGITHAVAELLLLPPGHLLRQHVGEGLAHDLLLDGRARAHLRLGIQAHRHVQELLVQERHAAFDAPGGKALVGAQAVVEM